MREVSATFGMPCSKTAHCKECKEWGGVYPPLVCRWQGLERNAVRYRAVICAWVRAKQLDQALELLADTQQESLEPDVITYSAVFVSQRQDGGPLETLAQQPASMLAVCWAGSGKGPQVGSWHWQVRSYAPPCRL